MQRYTHEEKKQKYMQMREKRRAKFRRRLQQIQPLLQFMRQAKQTTVDALVGVGKKYGLLRYPVIAVLAVFLFVYNLFYHMMICIKLQEKMARGLAFVLTLCMVATSVDLTALAVGNMADQTGEDAEVLVCGKEEHSHTDVCYEKILICGQEEGHVHGADCYETEQTLVCDNTEPAHIHTADCYVTQKNLVCSLEEDHVHTDACYEKVLTCDKEEHTHTKDCYQTSDEQETDEAVSTQSADGIAVQANEAVTFANDKYAYGKNMTATSVELVAELASGTATNVEWQYSADRNFSSYSVLAGQTGLTATVSSPQDGKWYRCVVNYNYKTKPVQLAKASTKTDTAVIYNATKTDGYWYVTNGSVAYTVNTTYFDVLGKYVKSGTTYWLGTSYGKQWDIFTATSANPSAESGQKSGTGGLQALRVAFISGDDYGINMEAQLASGNQAFAFGCDTMLGNDATSGNYSDYASLKAIKNESTGKVSQIQMVGAETVDTATVTDPSFVLKYNKNYLPTYYWLGHYNSRQLWTNAGSCDDFNKKTYSSVGASSADSGMTTSWCNIPSGGSVKFSFYVGSVENAGAAIKANANVTSTKITLTDLDTGYEYRLVDADGNAVAGYEGWFSPSADGELVFENLKPNTKYEVRSRKKGSSTTTGDKVDVDTTTALDPTQGGSGSGSGSSGGEETKPLTVSPDYTSITLTDANANYTYCLQDEDGYEISSWLTPANGTVTFTGLREGTTYYLVAKTSDNTKSDRIPYTTKIHTWTVTYNKNAEDATEAPSQQTKQTYEVLRISAEKLSRPEYIFLGWSTDANATSATYAPGDIYRADADLTLYAVWQKKAEISLDTTAQTVTYTGDAQAFRILTQHNEPTEDYQVTYYKAGTDTEVETPTDAGSYDLKITREEDAAYLKVDIPIPNGLVIQKASTWTKVPEGITTKATSYYTTNGRGKHLFDGSISGVTEDMEYSQDGGKTWNACSGDTISGLQDGTYALRYKENENHAAGRSLQVTIAGGTLDNQAPDASISIGKNTWNTFLNKITFGEFFKDTALVQIAATDNTGCGVESISYWKVSSEKSLDQVQANDDWTHLSVNESGHASVNVEPSGKKVVYIKTEDKLGNVAYYSTDGLGVYTLEDKVPVTSQDDLQNAIDAGLKNFEIPEDVKDFTISGDFTLPEDTSLDIPDDTELTIPEGTDFTNNGTITGGHINNSGSLKNDGTITGSTIDNSGELDNTGTLSDNNISNSDNAKITNTGSISEGKISNDGSINNGKSGKIESPVSNGENGQTNNANEVTWKDADGNEHYGSFEDATKADPKPEQIDVDHDVTLPEGTTKIPEGTTVNIPDNVKVTVPDGAKLDIPSGSKVNNNGTLDIAQGGSLDNKGNITGGDINNSGNLKNDGSISDGKIKNDGTIDNGKNGKIESPVSNGENGKTNNANEVTWKDADGNEYYGSFEDATKAEPKPEQIDVDHDVTLPEGTTKIPDGTTVNIPENVKVTVPDGAKLDIPSGSNVNNNGTLDIAQGGSLDNQGNIAGGNISNNGDLKNEGNISDSKLENNGTLDNSGNLSDNNINNSDNAKITNTGSISEGKISNDGTIDNGKNGKIDSPVSNSKNGKTNNANEVTWKDADGNEHYGSLDDALSETPAPTEITIDNDITLPEGETKIPDGTTVNIPENVKVTVPDGAKLDIPSGSNVNNNGTLDIASGGSLDNKGNITGGDINNSGNLKNDGSISDGKISNDGTIDNGKNGKIESPVSNGENGQTNNANEVTWKDADGNGHYGSFEDATKADPKPEQIDVDHDVTLPEGTTKIPDGTTVNIPEDVKVIVPDGAKLDIPSGSNVNNNGTLDIAQDGSVDNKGNITGGNISNNGDLKNEGNISDSKLENSGTLDNSGDLSDNNISNSDDGMITNNGTITDGKIQNDGKLDNKGNITGGDINNRGNLKNNGSISDGKIKNDGSIDNGKNGKIESPVSNGENGQTNNSNEVTWKDADGNEHYGSLDDALSATPAPAEITIDKDITLPEGTTKIPDGTTVNIPENIKITIPDGAKLDIQSGSNVNNKGTLDIAKGGSLAIAAGGTLDNRGNISSKGNIENSGSIQNNGSITNSGTFANKGQVTGSGQIIDEKKTPGNAVTPSQDDKSTNSNQTNTETTNVSRANANQQTGTKKQTVESKTEENSQNDVARIVYEDAKEQPIKQATNVSLGSGNILINITSVDEKGEQTEQSIQGLILTSCENVIKACLSDQEIVAVEEGQTVEITLTVQKITKSQDATDQKQIEKQTDSLSQQITGLTLGQFVDLAILKRVGNAEWSKITKLNEEMEIRLDVPEELQEQDRTYFIMRNHEGTCDLLEDLDAVAETITIRTDRFSTYAILYTDVAENQWNQTSEQTSNAGDLGTKNASCHWHLMLIALLIVFLILLYVMRKSSRWIRLIMLAINLVSGFAFAKAGTCQWDWTCFILDIAVSVAAFWALPQMKNSRDKE